MELTLSQIENLQKIERRPVGADECDFNSILQPAPVKQSTPSFVTPQATPEIPPAPETSYQGTGEPAPQPTAEPVAEPAAQIPQFNPWVHLFGLVRNFWVGRSRVQIGMSLNSIADCKAFYVSGWIMFGMTQGLLAWGLLTKWKKESIIALCLGLVMCVCQSVLFLIWSIEERDLNYNDLSGRGWSYFSGLFSFGFGVLLGRIIEGHHGP
jgi:hypothetical protein